MTVRGVRVHVPLGEVVLLLTADGLDLVLPVTIGPREGAAIASVLAGIAPPRPMTHDLTLDLLRAAGTGIDRVEIVGLRGGVFFAEIVLTDETRVDARTSDAVALALRAQVPVLCDGDVLERAGELDLGSEEDAGERPGESELAQFRAFLESVEPEDFDDADS
ncbi:hypothetical protein C8046_02205 [Serinibacter arcticus]|uniref:BFN domain-containing protein n=2 Tax=Serinibacter arcticus TaxID=1655435 RepID=A0A2U1ZZB4_9MICO|nr:hypothetical protein C8046_02205 [Serinibacter arcticus]